MNFNRGYISYMDAGFSSLFRDYITGVSTLRPLYNYSPSEDSFSIALNNAKEKPVNREVLVKVLTEQYNYPLLKEEPENYQKVFSNIQSLAQPNTITVSTGHQLCLFTGPLYFIYKMVSTINLAAQLKSKFPGYNIVPVYWMASEDHDFEEINHVNVFGSRIEWKKNETAGNYNPPSGRISTSSLDKVIQLVKEIAGESAHAGELIDLFTGAYLHHSNMADATRYIVHRLFGVYGLVVLNADDIRLKKLFAGIMKDELLNFSSYKLVNETIEYIGKAGYEAQVNPREINLFYITENSRERIIYEDEQYKVLNTSIIFSRESILKKLDEDPGLFSPNVILRPVYQQTILPNAAYVGGPAEIVYWLQLKKVFDHYRVNFPVLLPRNSVLLIDEKQIDTMNKLSLSDKDLFIHKDVLVKKIITQTADISFGDSEKKLTELYLEMAEKAAAADKTLKPAMEAELQRSFKALDAIKVKMLRAEKQKQEISVNRINKLKENLFPAGSIQERHDNIIPYYLKYGKGFIKLLIDSLNPLDFGVLLLKESPVNP